MVRSGPSPLGRRLSSIGTIWWWAEAGFNGCSKKEDPMTDSLTFVHFSDTHIVRPGVRLRDIDTVETLTRVIDTVNGLHPRPTFVLIGGDLVSPDIIPEVKTNAR